MLKFFVLAAIVGIASSGTVPVSDEFHAETKSVLNEISPEGVFHYAYETSNGIDVNSAGDEHAIKGAINYVSPEGEAVHLTYVADENGYQPQGDHLPTSPPIPEAIARAVEYIHAHPAADDVYSKGGH